MNVSKSCKTSVLSRAKLFWVIFYFWTDCHTNTTTFFHCRKGNRWIYAKDINCKWNTEIFVLHLNSSQRFHFLWRYKLDSNYTRMLGSILNKSWRQHLTKQQLYGHLPPITKTIKVRRTRHAVHCRRSMDELISDVLEWTPSHGRTLRDQLKSTYSSSVRIRDVAMRTC